ncbi:MAG: DUF397 domain-containing protein [Pseudonocardiaceae bacterium]
MTTAPEPDGIAWHTSSYSGSGEACVEVGWRTSSYSGGNGNCVEVAPAPDVVLVRDSKDRDGRRPRPAWRSEASAVLEPLRSTLATTT